MMRARQSKEKLVEMVPKANTSPTILKEKDLKIRKAVTLKSKKTISAKEPAVHFNSFSI